jgi:hypothetical protein
MSQIMNRTSIAGVLVCLAAAGCGGGSLTVGTGPDGKTYVHSEGGGLPPVDAAVGDKGIEPAPTETPGQPTPVYPIDTPVPGPTRTPRMSSAVI